MTDKESKKTPPRRLVVLIVITVVVVSLFFFLRKAILTYAARLIVGQAADFKVELGHFDINPFFGIVSIKNLRLYNPPEFNSGIFLNLPEVEVDAKISDFLTRRLVHLEMVRLNLDEVTVIRNAEGKTNLSILTSVSSQKETVHTEKERARQEKITFLIDELHLTMRNVNYVDHSVQGAAPKTYSFDMKINDKVMKNITNPAAIVGTIVLQIAYHTTIGNLGINFDGLQRQVESALANSEILARQGFGYLMAKKDVLEAQKFLDEAEANTDKMFDDANQAAGEAVRGLRNFFKTVAKE
ncbi:MAG: hypothetical protein HY587_01585 [Candidatus Omnitrophica bacterium]|nr:hypothetical protein [Candidatus Omnitrophota bacterium]